MSTNNIDEIFRRGTGDQTPDVPEYMWNRIDKEIRRNRQRLWFAMAASVVVLISIGVMLFTLEVPTPEITDKLPVDTTQSAPTLQQPNMLDAPNYADSATYIKE
ncbi:MAG: hypothetical protein J5651_08305 [Salinivirgaceae bacterium]|jgi:uncharacterized membrane protein|nr:hypothetical protein [Salinivirgaceae bacterium]MBO7432725.1 hypothetical protein [Salinivirgaceae bacterium]